MKHCLHCRRRKTMKARGLCSRCYRTVRHLYSRVENMARRDYGDFNGGYTLPVTPTGTQPGSLEKLAVLIERARQRVALWHPADRETCVHQGADNRRTA